MKLLFCMLLLMLATCSMAQQPDPEFPKGFIMHAHLHNGLVSQFNQHPDLYLGGLQLVPQFTLLPRHLRAGIIAGTFYSNNKLQWDAGATIAWKIKTLQAGIFGSAANLNLSVEHLWGTNQQRLFGAGLNIDLLNRLVIGLSAHRDYKNNAWWLQQSVAIRISKTKKIKEPFN